MPVRPLQFPSLGHFDARVQRAIDEARTVDGLKPSTLTWVRHAYANLRMFLVESKETDRFIAGDVDQQLQVMRRWIAWQRARDIGRTTINGRWRALSALLRWIADIDGTVNPLRLVTAPRPARRPPRCLTKEHAELVVEFVRNYPWATPLVKARNLTIIGLMLLAGLRRMEVVNLLYADVDEHQGTLIVRDGKGTAGGKTRTCYMPPQLRLIIEQYKRERLRAKRTTPQFIVDRRHDRGITAEPVRDLCARVAENLGMTLTPHVLRHTYATLLRQAGVPDRVSMDLLGHASLTMLQRYSHVFEGEHLTQASRLVLNVVL
ncbi:MAG: site-specific integrase [Thermoanaerobaculia bacterium]